MSEPEDGVRSEGRNFWNFELQFVLLLRGAFHAPRSVALADFFGILLEQDAVDVKGSGTRMPGDWLRHLRRCLSPYSSDGDKRQEERRLSPTGCQRAKR